MHSLTLVYLIKALDTYLSLGDNNSLLLNASKTKAMIVGTRGKLNATRDPAPLNAGNSTIIFVENFVYLGITLDRELCLELYIRMYADR